MKSFIIACLAATSTLAAPQISIDPDVLSALSNQSPGLTKEDVCNGVCEPVTYIFARGTSETGNLGASVGPALQESLESVFGANNVATQGVPYPADVAGAFTGGHNPESSEGALTMTSLTQQALSTCPDTKVILAGYSQGAEQVHGALMNLEDGQVAVAITFGDPLQSVPFENVDAGNTKIYCHDGDGVCAGAFNITLAHLTYADLDADSAAQFAKDIIGDI